MGKKHGFKGTPVHPSSRPSSMGRVFDNRGDPLVSPREGQRDFGRNLESENPDLDQYFAARRVEILKPEQIEKGEGFRKSVAKDSYDPNRKAAQILMKMRRDLRELGPEDVKEKTDKVSVTVKVPCPFGCSFRGTDKQVSHHLRIPFGQLGACRKRKV